MTIVGRTSSNARIAKTWCILRHTIAKLDVQAATIVLFFMRKEIGKAWCIFRNMRSSRNLNAPTAEKESTQLTGMACARTALNMTELRRKADIHKSSSAVALVDTFPGMLTVGRALMIAHSIAGHSS